MRIDDVEKPVILDVFIKYIFYHSLYNIFYRSNALSIWLDPFKKFSCKRSQDSIWKVRMYCVYLYIYYIVYNPTELDF
jgi:hypothetical protein